MRVDGVGGGEGKGIERADGGERRGGIRELGGGELAGERAQDARLAARLFTCADASIACALLLCRRRGGGGSSLQRSRRGGQHLLALRADPQTGFKAGAPPGGVYWPERRARRGVWRDRAVAMASMALPKRSTRGMRMNKLLEDEDSADEEFWNQDAFAEEEGDGVYESESEKEDVFDSDFDEDESSSDEEEVHVARERTKKVLKAPERKPVKPEGGAGAVPRKPKAPRVKPDPALMGIPMEDSEAVTWEDGVRKSSRAIVKDIRSKSEAAREAAARRPAPKRDPNQGVYKPMTQAEILAEAALTEVRNLRDLEHLLNIEEMTKKKAERVKKTHAHPCLRVRSVAVDAVDTAGDGRGSRESRTTIELIRSVDAGAVGNAADAHSCASGDVRGDGQTREVQGSAHGPGVPRRRRVQGAATAARGWRGRRRARGGLGQRRRRRRARGGRGRRRRDGGRRAGAGRGRRRARAVAREASHRAGRRGRGEEGEEGEPERPRGGDEIPAADGVSYHRKSNR